MVFIRGSGAKYIEGGQAARRPLVGRRVKGVMALNRGPQLMLCS